MDLREYITSADLSDDKVFAEAVRRVLAGLKLSDADLGSALAVSRPTVRRWANGVTTPHPAMREPLRRFTLRRLDQT